MHACCLCVYHCVWYVFNALNIGINNLHIAKSKFFRLRVSQPLSSSTLSSFVSLLEVTLFSLTSWTAFVPLLYL